MPTALDTDVIGPIEPQSGSGAMPQMSVKSPKPAMFSEAVCGFPAKGSWGLAAPRSEGYRGIQIQLSSGLSLWIGCSFSFFASRGFRCSDSVVPPPLAKRQSKRGLSKSGGRSAERRADISHEGTKGRSGAPDFTIAKVYGGGDRGYSRRACKVDRRGKKTGVEPFRAGIGMPSQIRKSTRSRS